MNTMDKYSNAMWAQILGSFTAKDIAEYRRQFHVFDVNKNGHIGTDELKSLAKSLGIKVSDEEIMDMVKICDFDKSGTIEFDEFLQMVFAVHFGEGGVGRFAELYGKATGVDPVPWKKPTITYSHQEVEAILKEFRWFQEAEEKAKVTEPEVGSYPRFVWDDELYGVGYPDIDIQHQKLFQIMDDLETMLRKGGSNTQLAKAMDELLSYTDYHFKSEETEMAKYDYPKRDAHAKMHQAFTDKMNTTASGLKVKLLGNEDVFDRRVVWEMVYFLRNWLINHIQKEDTAFGRYCKAAKATGKEAKTTAGKEGWFQEAEEGAKITEPEVGYYPRFVWDEELYGVGYPDIDIQHQKLFQIMDDLETMLRKGGSDTLLAKAVDELLSYTDYHFKSEETEMAKYDYPKRDAHAKMHQAFTDKMNTTAKGLKVKLAGNENVFNRRIVWEMVYFLRNWLINHIQKEDTAFGRHCREAKVKHS